MKEQKGLSTLGLAILGLVGCGETSAYEVRKVFSNTPMGHFSSSPGAIYPAMKRMEKAGWIRGRVVNRDTLRPKRVYRHTALGKKVLKKRLGAKVTRDDVVWGMDDLLLRFAFMDTFLDREEILPVLRSWEKEIGAYLEELKEIHARMAEGLSVCQRMSMLHGIESYEMNLAWVRRSAKEVVRANDIAGRGRRQKGEKR
jgi:DNA-binding PadR family transcriptional regulator